MRRMVSALSLLVGLGLLAAAFLAAPAARTATEERGAPAQRQLHGHHLPRPGAQLRLLRLATGGGDVRHAPRLSGQGRPGQRASLPRGREGLPEDLGRREDVHVHVAERLPVLRRLPGHGGELRPRDRPGPEPEDAVSGGDVRERHRRGRQGPGRQGHPSLRRSRERQHAHRAPHEGGSGLPLADRDAVLLRDPPNLPIDPQGSTSLGGRPLLHLEQGQGHAGSCSARTPTTAATGSRRGT